MGVQGLWKLLEPTGRPVVLESLQGKILAVDISIWLYQALYGMRDKDGRSSRNGHLMLLFNRICKLLYYGIKPVFVFDGATPQLKLKTMSSRQHRRYVAAKRSQKLANKLLKNVIKTAALNETVGASSSSGLDGLVLGNVTRDDDPFQLPPLSESLQEDPDDTDLPSHDTDVPSPEAPALQRFEDISMLDVDSAEFKALPSEIQHELISEKRLADKEKTLRYLEDVPMDYSHFSSFQLERLIGRRTLSRKLEELEKEMASSHSASIGVESDVRKVVESKRIISKESAHYILVNLSSQSSDEESSLEREALPKSCEVEHESPSCSPVHSIQHKESFQPHPQSPELHPQSSEPHPQSPELHPQSSEPHPQSPELHPQSSEPHPQSPELHPQSSEPHPQSPELHPQSPELHPQSPELHPQSPELHPQSPELHPQSPELHPQSSEPHPQSPELHPQSAEPHPQSPELHPQSSEPHPQSSEPHPQSPEPLPQPHVSPSTESTSQISQLSYREAKEKSAQVQAELVPHPLPVEPIEPHPLSVEPIESHPLPVEPHPLPAEPHPLPTEPHPLPAEPHPLPAEPHPLPAEPHPLPAEPHPLPAEPHPLPAEPHPLPAEPIEPHPLPTEPHPLSVEPHPLPAEPQNCGQQILAEEEVGYITSSSSGELSDVDDAPVISDVNVQRVKQSIEGPSTTVEATSLEPEGGPGGDEHKHFISDAVEMDINVLSAQLSEERKQLQMEQGQQSRYASEMTAQIYREAQELLTLFKMPFILSPSEAEAQCAWLDQQEMVAGTITDDNDYFLFGGKKLYRHFFSSDYSTEMYSNSDIQQCLGVSRKNLVVLAYLTGSDYTNGVDGIGVVTATEILRDFPGSGLEVLEKFKEWHQAYSQSESIDKHMNHKRLLKLSLPTAFPDRQIMSAYMNPIVDESHGDIEWGFPDMYELKQYAIMRFGWSELKATDTLSPVFKKMNELKDSQTKITHFLPKMLPKEPKLKSKRMNRAILRMKGRGLRSKEGLDQSGNSKTTTVIENVSSSDNDSDKVGMVIPPPQKRARRKKKIEEVDQEEDRKFKDT